MIDIFKHIVKENEIKNVVRLYLFNLRVIFRFKIRFTFQQTAIGYTDYIDPPLKMILRYARIK